LASSGLPSDPRGKKRGNKISMGPLWRAASGARRFRGLPRARKKRKKKEINLLLARRRGYFMTLQDHLPAHLDACVPPTSFLFVHCVRCRCYRVRTSLHVTPRLYCLLDLRGTLCSYLDMFVPSVSPWLMRWILHVGYRVLVSLTGTW